MVVPRVVDAVCAAGSVHAAIHRGIRYAAEPAVLHLSAQSQGSGIDAVAGLQGRVAGRVRGAGGGGLAGVQAISDAVA
ncbi:hypothetical protein D3C84_1221880 [compost metagenome]